MSSPVPTDPTPMSGPPRAPVVEFVAAQRGAVGVALLALGVLFLAAAGYCLVKGYGTAAPPVEGADPDAPPAVALNPYQTEYLGGGITGLLGAAAGLALGGGLLGRLKPRTREATHREARWVLLLAGGLFGLALLFLGLWLLGSWFDVISKWVNDRDASQAWKPLTALLVFLAGAGIAFAAVQPARAEERNNADLRRLCYGLNFGLSALLLVVGLVVANIVVGLKLPAQLDTTDEGFYSLDPLTKEFLGGLTQDVTVYSTIVDEDSREGADVNRMLDAAREVNPARFKVRRVAQTDKSLIRDLTEKFKGINVERELGLIVATGPKESQYSLLRGSELFTRSDDPRDRRRVFQGESKLVNELLFLADNKSRPVVYFTQGSREMQLDRPPGGPAAPADRSCGGLKEPLLKNYIEAKPLAFDLNEPNPKVPDDAAAVVLADPVGPLSAPTLAALKTYLNTPGRNGRKGKLVVLAGLHAKPDGGSHATNVNELLSPLGVTLADKIVYSESSQELEAERAVLMVPPALGGERNPLGLSGREVLVVPAPRLLTVAAAGEGPPGVRATAVLNTLADRPTWLEAAPLPNPDRAWIDVVAAYNRRDADVIREKNPARTQRPVAAYAVETAPTDAKDGKDVPRLVVFGFGSSFSDEATQGRDTAPTTKLFVAAVNWLRDRPPAAAVANKTYGEYRPTKAINFASGFWLPVVGLFVVVLFLGLGVWSYRRK